MSVVSFFENKEDNLESWVLLAPLAVDNCFSLIPESEGGHHPVKSRAKAFQISSQSEFLHDLR